HGAEGSPARPGRVRSSRPLARRGHGAAERVDGRFAPALLDQAAPERAHPALERAIAAHVDTDAEPPRARELEPGRDLLDGIEAPHLEVDCPAARRALQLRDACLELVERGFDVVVARPLDL